MHNLLIKINRWALFYLKIGKEQKIVLSVVQNVSAGVVVDYADMTMTMLTWTVTFCCSLRRKIKYTYTIILSFDNWGLAQV